MAEHLALMAALLLLLTALALGFSITRWLGLSLHKFELTALSIVLGLFGFTWLNFATALLLPYSLSVPIACAASLALAAGLYRYRAAWQSRNLSAKTSAAWVVVAGVSLWFWGYLMLTHDLMPMGGSLMSAGATWGDFGIHASLVSHQAAAAKLPLDLPVASGTTLTYPFLIDFLSALLVRAGSPIGLALAVPGTLLAWAITQLAIGFGWRLYGRWGGAVLGTVLTFTGGAIGGLGIAWNDWQASGQPLITWLGRIPRDYTSLDVINANFNNAVADLMLPQRGFLFGLGIWLTVAIIWHTALSRAANRRLLVAAGVLVGLLPLAHPHSFVAAGVLYTGLVTHIALKRRHELPRWLLAGGLMMTLALPQILWQQLASPAGTGGHVTAGWDRLPGQNLLTFEWQNFGFLLPLLAASAVLLTRPRFRAYRPWLVPFGLLFVGAQLYSLQAFAYDNLKLFFYVYLMAMLALGAAIWHVRNLLGRIALIIAAVAAFSLSGLLSITREFQMSYVFASPDDIALASWAKSNTPPSEIFATTDVPNQPLATLAGRNLVLGYRGWLYSYSLPYAGREQLITSLLAGDFVAPGLATYQPRYLVVGATDNLSWTVNTAALNTLSVAYRNPSWTVYSLPRR